MTVFVVPRAISEYRSEVHAVLGILGPIPPGSLVLGGELRGSILRRGYDLNEVTLVVVVAV